MVMPKRPVEEQNKHDQQIVDLAAALEYDEKFSNVHTDDITDDYPSPEVINQRRPDLITEYRGREIIIEIETKSSIAHRHTEKQWQAFNKAVEDGQGNYGGFVIVVPESLEKKAKDRAAELEVDPDIWALDF
jgi:hypothetical protein